MSAWKASRPRYLAFPLSVREMSTERVEEWKSQIGGALSVASDVQANPHPLPTWLRTDFAGEADPLVSATVNWATDEFIGQGTPDVQRAWDHFRAGEYVASRSALDGLFSTVGTNWGPRSTADSLRTWHWIRLVVELADLESGTTDDNRRSATSAYELACRSVPENEELLDELAEVALGDFAAADMASRRAWCAYTARSIACSDHERVLQGYTNEEKASLRRAWADQFGLTPDDVRSTVAMANTVRPRLMGICQRLYVDARSNSTVARSLRQARRELPVFLDERESKLFDETIELLLDLWRAVDSQVVLNQNQIKEHVAALEQMGRAIATSGSLILQDYLAPHLARVAKEIDTATAHLADISRPAVVARLDSATLPFSAAPGTDYPIRLIVANHGNAAAESLVVRLLQPQLEMEASTRLDSLRAGAERSLELWVKATGAAPKAIVIECEMTWSDALMQEFSGSCSLPAEDQKPASWTSSDVNPFSLGTISDPARLVGRDEDLARLAALLAGGGSAYVTGHKRVGKTSLARVLLSRCSTVHGWAGGLMSLGRAMGPEQSASELVYALMDEILNAIRRAYPRETSALEQVQEQAGVNFARAADRWLQKLALVLPEHARVVVTIDDFDELPPKLIDGPQADALFLFLRTLVDEPWLNLIVVGSELLPSIIDAQAHKLNQVVPISVSNFTSRAATQALLVTPTIGRLEWQPEAIDRVHYLCRGNPYYETLIAQQIWPTLREMRRSFVTVSDVDAAAAEIARNAPASHFVHLWADSATGIDHTSRRAVVTSAVLRAVARSGGESNAAAPAGEVVSLGQTWIQTATAEELQQVVASLVRRGVLERGPSEGSLLMSIPLVSLWLSHAGSRALDEQYAASSHAIATELLVTASDLTGLSRGLMYRGEHISEIRIRAWLDQFGDNYHQFLAFQMLRRMVSDGYFTPARLHDRVMPKLAEGILASAAGRHIIRDNNQYLKNVYLVDHGVAGDSTQGTISALRTKLKVKKAHVCPVEELIGKMKVGDDGAVIFLLDDFVGSGRHLEGVLDNLLERLPQLGGEWEERVHIVVGGIVVSDLGSLPGGHSSASLSTASGLVLGNRFRAFSPDSGVFETEKQRADAEDLVTTIGRALLPSNPVGFGNEALLALLEFNCPNNAPPVFWRRGLWGNRSWEPLFERAF